MISFNNGVVALSGEHAFSPERTFMCGQCFRFTKQPDGSFAGIAFGKKLTVSESGGATLLRCGEPEFEGLWRPFLDLDGNYAGIAEMVAQDRFLSEAERFGRGIRILRQDPWEAFCSFIISQCNNIPRIQGIISRLCELFGEKLEGGFSFPSAQTLAAVEPSELAPLRAGYRAEYIVNAARAVASGALDLRTLSAFSCPTEQARKELMSVRGVGKKVADCTLLFGLHRTDSFPIDVWMKRTLSAVYPGGFDSAKYGEYAGIIQQYIFYYSRERGLFT